MKLPSKKEVKEEIQFFLMIWSMVNGFIFSYIWLWYKLGLPLNGLMIVVPTILGVLSCGGLCHWIRRDNNENL